MQVRISTESVMSYYSHTLLEKKHYTFVFDVSSVQIFFQGFKSLLEMERKNRIKLEPSEGCVTGTYIAAKLFAINSHSVKYKSHFRVSSFRYKNFLQTSLAL